MTCSFGLMLCPTVLVAVSIGQYASHYIWRDRQIMRFKRFVVFSMDFPPYVTNWHTFHNKQNSVNKYKLLKCFSRCSKMFNLSSLKYEMIHSRLISKYCLFVSLAH